MSALERNRILQGDALSLMRDWPSQSVDLLLSDPPYGNAVAYGRARRTIIGDEHPLIGLQAVAAAYRLLKRNSTAYVFCAPNHLGLLEHFILRYTKFRMREVLVWNKKQVGFGYTFRRAYECILVLEKGEPTYYDTPIPNLLSYSRGDTKLHPHAKPLPLLERLIRSSSLPGDLVFDPFAGSGSTLLAAKNLDRNYLGVEIDEGYAQIARGRLAGQEKAA